MVSEPLSLAALGFACLCFVLGGGGPHAPVLTMIVELASVAILAVVFALPRNPALPRISLGAWAVIVAVLALFVIQLAPLPIARWSALPGRTILVNALTIERGQLSPHALSLSPRDTLDDLFFMLVPLASFAVASRIMARGRLMVAAAIVASAQLGVLLEAIQFAGAGLSNLYVPEQLAALPAGLFANHNHQADFIAIAITMLVPLGRAALDRYKPALVLAGAAAVHVVLLVGVVATQSRAGAMLTALASLWLAVGGYWPWWRRQRVAAPRAPSAPSARRWILPAVIVVGVIALVLAVNSTPAQQFIGRFSDLQDQRTTYLPNLWLATSAFMPWGSGLGSYPIVFHAYEDLNLLGPTFFNHAHDDYIELLMEGGYPAIGVLGVFVLFFLWSSAVVARRSGPDAPLARSAVVAIFLVMLHSIGDYPLRTHAIAAAFGFAAAIIALRDPRQPGEVV